MADERVDGRARVAERLAEAIELAGFSHAQVGRALGVSADVVDRLCDARAFREGRGLALAAADLELMPARVVALYLHLLDAEAAPTPVNRTQAAIAAASAHARAAQTCLAAVSGGVVTDEQAAEIAKASAEARAASLRCR